MSPWVTWPVITKKLGMLGVLVSLLILALEREDLFENNLFDVAEEGYYAAELDCSGLEAVRTLDGTCNILENPLEGSIHTVFGRNVDPESAVAELDSGLELVPNPREVSNLLMARDEFKPATTLNFIAAAWIQFMTHDWFEHNVMKDGTASKIEVPVPANDPTLEEGEIIEIDRTLFEGVVVDSYQDFDEKTGKKRTVQLSKDLPVYRNQVTHWWDGSQIYGVTEERNAEIREFEGGRLKLDAEGFIPTRFSGVPIQGFEDNFWVGLSMLHNLFVKEHNAIAAALQAKYPLWSDEQIYNKARLINAALMAKIHTVEWTPAIISNPTTIQAMYANWWGLLGSRGPRDKYQEKIRKLYESATKFDSFFKRILKLDPLTKGVADIFDETQSIELVIGGLVGSRNADNRGVPFTLTEEFVQVYRMHPLMRDDIELYDLETNELVDTIAIEETTFGDGEKLFQNTPGEQLWYSFGITNPGALTLGNYPEFLRNIKIPFRKGVLDLATIDIVRDRERGVPRYNEFRRQIGLKPITSFEQLFAGADMEDPENQALLADMKKVYLNDVELIDTFVGEMAESVRPEGFGFSETAFQIFIMNASRRLLTDRYYTSHYNKETYTALGLDWVEGTTMVDVLLRHYPELSGKLENTKNAFAPWGQPWPPQF